MNIIVILDRVRCWNHNGCLFPVPEPKTVYARPKDRAWKTMLEQFVDCIMNHEPAFEEGFEDLLSAAAEAPRKITFRDKNGNELDKIDDTLHDFIVEYGEDDGIDNPVLIETFTLRTIETGWRFIAEEEIGDPDSPVLFLGVLTNGDDCLYYRVLAGGGDGANICTIHNSLTFEDGSEEVSYPWTAENDQKVIDALNANTDSMRIAGEDSVLLEIEFDAS